MAKGHKTGGRKTGSVNKATADIKALAQTYTGEALATLASIMRDSESAPARVAAIKELLDRGHGKSAMAQEDATAIAGIGTILAGAWARFGGSNA